MDSTLDLSQFEIIKKVGEGSFGEVFQVKEKKSDQILAAKVSLIPLSEASEDIIQNLSREVNIIVKLNNPSIVKFIGYSPIDFQKDPNPVIITEFLSNGSLEDILNLERGGLCKDNWDDTRKLINIYGIAKAMSYLHEHNIIHRDLKPANILMDSYLFPKITDFGLSKINDPKEIKLQSKATTTVKGTPIYTAPEIYTSFEYTNAGDVYAFAIIVYEIMTNEIPYKNCNFIDLSIKVMNNIRPTIIGIPESYQNLIERCWDQDPSNRPSFNEIVEELKNNPEFITDMVELVDYEDYIDFIDNCEISFDNNKSINIIDFEKKKQFKKVIIDKSLLNNIKDDDDDNDSTEDEEISNKTEDVVLTKNELPFKLPPCDPDTEKYRKIFIDKVYKSPKEEIPNILFTYAAFSHYGKYIPKNVKEAQIFYKIAADMGHVNSMFLLGKLYCEGKDYDKAMHYYQKAADQGSTISMLQISTLYMQGLGRPINLEETAKYFKMAADLNDANGMALYASVLYKGTGTKPNKTEAIKYFKKSIDKGNRIAMKLYGLVLLDDDKNSIEGFNYLKMAADKGDITAIEKVGNILFNKPNATEIDYDESFKYYKMAYLNNKRKPCMSCIRSLINRGLISAKNINDRTSFIKESADKNDTEAMITWFLLKSNRKYCEP